MNRREALSRVAILIGGTVIGGNLFLTGCKSTTADGFVLTAKEMSLFEEVAESILPETAKSGGAKAAQVGSFAQLMVRDCYSLEEQKAFTSGLGSLDEACEQLKGKSFIACNATERQEFLVSLDPAKTPYYSMIRQLTLLGYFTSEIGYKAQNYQSVPGGYEGAIRKS
ncbi:hypothetical protein IWX76_001900 [Pedobacter sp. CAN_A7]|uniref:gluconate 2-dehydrogenase subunit 3 family protein n=1 Tax=Pedobacter sp. CAN_A7 TaxID=2787722 RepID=UPI0018CA4A29